LGGGGGPGSGGAGAVGVPALPEGGVHFCRIDRTPETAWIPGVSSSCRVIFGTGQALTSEQQQQLDMSCAQWLGTVVSDCPRADVVGYCEVYALPTSLTGARLIYASALTPDTVALSLNVAEICQGAGHAPTGEGLHPRCTATTLSARIDGQSVAFTQSLSCKYKSDGVRSELTFGAADGASILEQKGLQVTVHEEGGLYTFGMQGQYPAALYSEGGTMGSYTAFNQPEDPTSLTIEVMKAAPRGAAFTAAFTLGRMKGGFNGQSGTRTITDGMVDLTLTP